MSQIISSQKKFSELRTKAEERLKEKKKKLDAITTIDLEHELSIHDIKLQIQKEELLKTQAKLKSALKEYEDLFEFSPVGYFILDRNGVIENANERGCFLIGKSKIELIGKHFSEYIDGNIQQNNFHNYRNHIIKNERFEEQEFNIKRKNGTDFCALIKGTIVKNEQSEFKHFLLIVGDISLIKEHERQIELALQKSNELNELKSQFITMTSHEFRTPLATILTASEMIEKYLKPEDTEKREKYARKIIASVNRLNEILMDFESVNEVKEEKTKNNS